MDDTVRQLEYVERQLGILHTAADQLAAGLDRLRREIRTTPPEQSIVSKEATESPCASCSKYDTCTEPCGELLKLLPPEDAGQLTLTGQTPLEVIQHDQGTCRIDNRDLLDRFEACWAELTPKRREVVRLVVGVGLTQKEAAERLKKAESTVSELLAEATKTMHAFHTRRHRGADQ